ncbi:MULTISPECIES: lantibiotic ABC transporter permease [Streptococcus]|uniref:lantibiotic ABC transporter permease n=1 Tax=Streptococcus TaxID=1301 RepID=UPI0015E5C7FA|nr:MULTISPECIES: lantibiotic ABC transporter permease [Streptococcus]MBA1351489.1 lantibiotic ABC transporter permease [Streptococcus oralis subsp. oralis]MBK3298053.1 lantibiotic ABC transporter permease [Streptococcus oralis]MBS9407345.1 lantibiotic ABC transporter permease [Streptococcus oralis]WFR87520.1 lantibiotic ABC transporter permease [Streptococcus sp. D7B5]
MEKNRLFILISAGVAILGSLLPWASLNAGSFGSYSVNGYQGDGWFVIIAAIVSIVLACLNNMNKAMSKGFSIGVIVAGAIATLVTLNSLFNVNKYMSNFGGYGISIGFGLILAILASIALVVTGLLAMSGGKITKESFTELAESGKDFAQTVGRVTSSTVKTAVEEIKKESQERKKEETTADKTEIAKEETEQKEEAKEPANVEAESAAENAEPVKEETTESESETKTEAEPVAEPTETEAEAETVTESTETEPTKTEKEAKSAEENAEPVKETEVKNQQEEKAPNQEN